MIVQYSTLSIDIILKGVSRIVDGVALRIRYSGDSDTTGYPCWLPREAADLLTTVTGRVAVIRSNWSSVACLVQTFTSLVT